MDNRLINSNADAVQRLQERAVRMRMGVVTATSPLSVAVGGSTVPYTNVRAIGAVAVNDKVVCLMGGNDIVVLGNLSGTGGGGGGGSETDPIATAALAAHASDTTAIHGIADTSLLVDTSDLAAYALLASPTFTGDPKAPTPSPGDNDTSIATTAFVTAAIATGGGSFQPLDSDLTAIAALSTTSFGRALLALADAAALRSTAGLVIGTNVQAWDADLDAIAALATTTIGRSLLAASNATALRVITDAVGLSNAESITGGKTFTARADFAPATDVVALRVIPGATAVGVVGRDSANTVNLWTISGAGKGNFVGLDAGSARIQSVADATAATDALNRQFADGRFAALVHSHAQSDITGLTAALAALQPLDSDLTAIAALSTTSFGRSLLALADAAALRSTAGLVIGTNVQAQNANLQAIAGLTTAAGQLTKWTGSGAATTIGLTGFAELMLNTTGPANWQDTLNLQPGIDVQAWDADLDAIAALATTAYGRSFLALADAAAARTLTGAAAASHTHLAADLPAAIAYENEINVFTKRQDFIPDSDTAAARFIATATSATIIGRDAANTANVWTISAAGKANFIGLDAGSQRIQSVADATAATDALNRQFADGRYQPIDTDLTAIAALATTAFGRSFLALADAAAARTLIGAAATSHTHVAADLPATIAYLDAVQTFTRRQSIQPSTDTAGLFLVRNTDGGAGNFVAGRDAANAATVWQVTNAGKGYFVGLDAGSQKITSVATPTATDDAATKGYVDGLAAAAGSRWVSGTFNDPVSQVPSAAFTQYWAYVAIPAPCTLSGVEYRVGATAAGSARCALYNSAGTRIGNTTTSQTQATAGAGGRHQVAFDAAVAVVPGVYYVLLVFTLSTSSFYGHTSEHPAGTATGAGIATPASVTPPAANAFGMIPKMITY